MPRKKAELKANSHAASVLDLTLSEQARNSDQFPLFDYVSAETEKDVEAREAPGVHSNFIVYVDESGDHSLTNVDKDYPIFVLAFCIFYKGHYSEKVVPALEKLKFNWFGQDIIILHERDIRKEIHPFAFQNRPEKIKFLGQLTDIIEQSNFILISYVIRKDQLDLERFDGVNIYHLALSHCLDGLHQFLEEKAQTGKETHVIFESRGTNEDRDLELEFRRICDGENRLGRRLPFKFLVADKKANSSGLQLADLVARPIGLSVLRPTQHNRAFEVLKRKFYCSGGRAHVGEGYEGWGLKILPAPKSEKPRRNSPRL